jgi:tetratricopeptide (TPR) repeat protein
MALVNTGGILAGRRGFRVLVIDLDLEAPGLSYLAPDAGAEERQQAAAEPFAQPGFVDLLTDAKQRGPEVDLFILSAAEIAQKYTREYWLPDELRQFKDGSLHIMPAGMFDGKYAMRLDALDLPELYRDGLGEPLVRAFKEKFAGSGLYDYVLIDSRTGFSDEAGICTRDLADHLMILSGLNRQNVEGTAEFLRALRVATDGKKRFEIVLSPIPTGEDKLFEEREAAEKRSFEVAWQAEVNLSLQIPYHPQLALTEEPHIFRRRRGPLFEAYRAIEASMLSSIGHDAATFERRITESLTGRDFLAALRDLRRLVRLDGGKSAVARVAQRLAWASPTVRRRKGELDTIRGEITLEELLKDSDGRDVVEFIVMELPIEEREWVAQQLLVRLNRKAPELAHILVTRVVQSPSAGPEFLTYFATVMDDRGSFDIAEVLYRRAVEKAPDNAWLLASYARFLQVRREDFGNAETFYHRSLKIEPNAAPILGDYGQFLFSVGRLDEAEEYLLRAFASLDADDYGNLAEIYFSLWLLNRIQARDGMMWESGFKFLLLRKFARHSWNFDQLLRRAASVLQRDELDYAKALAAAFLNKRKMAALDNYARWRSLKPSDPKALKTGTPVPI